MHLIKYILFLIMWIWPSSVLSPFHQKGDYVVILHGIARTSFHMKSLENYLKYQKYDVINLDYPSTEYDLNQLTDYIYTKITQKTPLDKPIHLVGYSMGGLLLRTIIFQYSLKNLGHLVQLAPPNHGSEVADFLQNNRLFKWIFGPAGQQLVTNQQNIIHLLGSAPQHKKIGIIAGNTSIDPISSWIIPNIDDGKVSVQSTKLKGNTEHIIVSSSHAFFPYNSIVQYQTAYFLKYNKFDTRNLEIQ